MANLVLAFAELLGGAVLLDAGIKGDSLANVITGKATSHPLNPNSSSSSGSASSSSSSSSTSSGPSSVPTGSYTNPVPGASASRIDEGGDYTLSSQGFLAPGKSKIVAITGNFFRGGTVIAQLLDGPLAGQFYYVAEGIRPTVAVGDTVNAGQQIAAGVASPYNGIVGNIEAGWSDANGTPLAQSTGGYTEGQATAAGAAWDAFVHSLGGVVDHANTAIFGHLTGVLAGL